MVVSITRVDKLLPLPRYESNGATAFDFVTRENTTIPAGAVGLVPGNVVVAVPPGYTLLVLPRSSLPKKKSLICPHSIGVIDRDYCGPQDEIYVQVQNVSNAPVTIERGERIAQGLFVKVERAEWVESAPMGMSRGGFGSTGEKIFKKTPSIAVGGS